MFTVVYVGLGLQFFQLRAGKHGTNLLVAIVLVLWVVPLVVGSVLGETMAVPGERVTVPMAVMSLSPVAGMITASGLNLGEVPEAVRFAALVPPLVLTFVFNYLLVVTQRRIDLVVRTAARGPKGRPVEELARTEADR